VRNGRFFCNLSAKKTNLADFKKAEIIGFSIKKAG
jgi:hypothetical protein